MRRSPRKHRSTRANERDPFESDTDHLEIVGQDVTPGAKRDLPYRHRDPEKQTHQQSQSVYPPPCHSLPHSSSIPALAVHSLARRFLSALLKGKMTYHQKRSSKSMQPGVGRDLKTTTIIYYASQKPQLEPKSMGKLWLKLPCQSMIGSTKVVFATTSVRREVGQGHPLFWNTKRVCKHCWALLSAPSCSRCTMHHHPFANPTLSPRKKIISPPKLTTFIYTQFSQNNGCFTRD
jgi:hypothetical protein